MNHIRLFQPNLIKLRLGELAPIPQDHLEILQRWQTSFASGRINKIKEVSLQGEFLTDILGHILGYDGITSAQDDIWNWEAETHIQGVGHADAGLGFISEQHKRLIAPVELKGAKTSLDHTMSRGYTPVQQAWRYANAIADCRWVLVSNYKELRLYATSRTPTEYESFDISKLTEPAEYWRLQLLLNKTNFLAGSLEEASESHTDKLLQESGAVEKAITKRLYNDYRSIRSDLFTQLQHANPNMGANTLIAAAQKILDRVLFIAFAEDVGLLPHNILLKAFESNNAFNPAPIWFNFMGLFQAVDKGNAALSIPAYNGGLFAPDAMIDSLRLPDSACEHFKALAAYDFASEVSVTVLGHIFEQSITDLEEMKDGDITLGKRKTDGVFYTPDAITRFIVEETIGGYLKQQFDALKEAQTGRTSKKRDIAFWEDYRDNVLKNLKICDPACGSGAFLVAAFDYLHAEYRRVADALHDLTGGYSLFDLNKTILTQNLYGVDINPESIEISKLSLWLKTAEQGKPLTSLDANIQQGNSLLDTDFDWLAAFPDVFKHGGFDIILGNPPYVRMELIKPLKPYLKANYVTHSERADLFIYFFERGVSLLKDGGRLGYISSSTFFKTAAGKPLRQFLNANVALETIVDFGDMQVFEGATTYPAILIMQKMDMDSRLRGNLSTITIRPSNKEPAPSKTKGGCGITITLLHSNKDPAPAKAWVGNPQVQKNITFIDALSLGKHARLADVLTAHRQITTQASLSEDGWRLESQDLAKLRHKLMHTGKSLKEVCGSPLYGIKTGFNQAFVIDGNTKQTLIAQDANSAKLIKPLLEGKDLKPWHVEPRDLWLIYIAKGVINIEDYPAIKQHLLPFKEKLESRATKQAWFELQQPQQNYVPTFEGIKIVYPNFFGNPSSFSQVGEGVYTNNKVYLIPNADNYLLGVLNSKVMWFILSSMCTFKSGQYYDMHSIYVEKFPIPKANQAQHQALSDLAAEIQALAESRFEVEANFRHRLACDLGGSSDAKLNKKLQAWFDLDFPALRKAVKASFKADIPLAERSDWEAYFVAEKNKVDNFNQQIQSKEDELNQQVYALFKLKDKDIKLIEENIQ